MPLRRPVEDTSRVVELRRPEAVAGGRWSTSRLVELRRPEAVAGGRWSTSRLVK
jgi:hypothetical protein